jgi:hypothetical protein
MKTDLHRCLFLHNAAINFDPSYHFIGATARQMLKFLPAKFNVIITGKNAEMPYK